jgi:hypothetical protein
MGNLLMCVLNPLPITIVGNNIPFERCPYGSEHTIAHDTFLDILANIVLESGAHVRREVSHLIFRHIRQ